MNVNIEFLETIPVRCWHEYDNKKNLSWAFSSQYEATAFLCRYMAEHTNMTEIKIVAVPDGRTIAIVKRG